MRTAGEHRLGGRSAGGLRSGAWGAAALGLALVTVLAAASPARPAHSAAPHPVVPACTGYTEKRIYLENQSWWEPQPGPAAHPGTGKQGHVHVGACFPLYQRVAGTLQLDLKLHLHNMPGRVDLLRVDVGRGFKRAVDFEWECAESDCDREAHVDVPLEGVRASGWQPVTVFLNVLQTDGTRQRNVTRWFVFVDSGAPRVELDRRRLAGDAWYTNHGDGSRYAGAELAEGDLPWDPSTGKLAPLSGTWRPTVVFSRAEGRVLVDPALHAVPPREGVRVFAGAGGGARALRVNTRKLANGLHRLLVASCDPRPEAKKNCGVLVVPFLVRNARAAGHHAGHAGHAAGPAAAARPGISLGQARVAASAGQLVATVPVRYRNGVPVVAGTVMCEARGGDRPLTATRAHVADGVASCTWRLRGGEQAAVGAIAVRASTVTARRTFAATL